MELEYGTLILIGTFQKREDKMTEKQTVRDRLTAAELKSMLLAHFAAEYKKQLKLQAQLQQEEPDYAILPVQPEACSVIMNKYMDLICDLLACRLKESQRTTPLISAPDASRIVSLLLDEIATIRGFELEAGKREAIEGLLRPIYETVFELTYNVVVLPNSSPYDEYWRWVTIVLDLAAESGNKPTELLTSETTNDEITRRMFTREQFTTISQTKMNKLLDADALKKIMFSSALAMVGEALDDEEERNELEQWLEAQLMPQLCEHIERLKAVCNVIFDEEVARIYGAA
jgi:hypothetical protein